MRTKPDFQRSQVFARRLANRSFPVIIIRRSEDQGRRPWLWHSGERPRIGLESVFTVKLYAQFGQTRFRIRSANYQSIDRIPRGNGGTAQRGRCRDGCHFDPTGASQAPERKAFTASGVVPVIRERLQEKGYSSRRALISPQRKTAFAPSDAKPLGGRRVGSGCLRNIARASDCSSLARSAAIMPV